MRARTANRSFDAQLRLNGRFDTGFLSHTVFLGLERWDFYYGYNNDIARHEGRRRSIFLRPSIRRESAMPAPSDRTASRARSAAPPMAGPDRSQ
ncbi:MAG: hypothetical protein U1E25_12495 [Methylocystis sp.]